MFDKLLNRQETVENVVNHDALKTVEKEFELQKMRFKEFRTSNLWLSFCEMVAVLNRFLLTERTGDWELHLLSVQEMLPYIAAEGHNLYTKSAYIYLSRMQNLKATYPDIYAHFM